MRAESSGGSSRHHSSFTIKAPPEHFSTFRSFWTGSLSLCRFQDLHEKLRKKTRRKWKNLLWFSASTFFWLNLIYFWGLHMWQHDIYLFYPDQNIKADPSIKSSFRLFYCFYCDCIFQLKEEVCKCFCWMFRRHQSHSVRN